MPSTSNTLPNAIITNNELTPCEKHNSQVIAYIKRNPLSIIQQQAIKLFTDNCQRNKLNDEAYNKAVDTFNKQHGLLITKKVIDSVNPNKYDTGKYYNYINYPFIDSEAFKLAMQKYRAEIKRYNDSLIDANKAITTYNNSVLKNLSPDQKIQLQHFKKKNERLFTKTYNTKAEQYNTTNNNIILKKRIQKVKFQSEIIFSIILGFYSKQLSQRNAFQLDLNLPTSINKNQLPALKIDYRKLANHKIDGVQRLDICKKTAQNHIKRLREAGIINNYLFTNSNQPIKCAISGNILVVLDGNSPKTLISENQLFTDNPSNVLHDNSDTTSNNILKEYKIKDSATSCQDQIRSLPKQTVNSCAAHKRYKNTQNIKVSSSVPPKKNEKRSENLRKLLVAPHILAQQLANNEFLGHTALRKERLLQEVQYGNLTRAEFQQLLIYDYFKISNRIYKESTVFAGEWTKTIKKALDTWFINNNALLQKQTMYDKIDQYRWMIEFARKWFTKKEVKVTPLFPYQYFNKKRTLSKEIGFFGLESTHRTKLKIEADKLETDKVETRDNNIRKHRLTELNKAERKVKQYLKGTLKVDELYNYIQNNLSQQWIAQVPKLIEKLDQKNVA